jgi:AraC family transcriptional regulator
VHQDAGLVRALPWRVLSGLAGIWSGYAIKRRGPLVDPELSFAEIEFVPRLFFFDAALWDTVLKLKALIEIPGKRSRLYAEALSVVLAHELSRLNGNAPFPHHPFAGGSPIGSTALS